MEISYGPPGLRGVTTLMAVGDADYEEGRAERAITVGTYVSGAAWVLGFVLGSRTVRQLAAGGLLAMLGARAMARGPAPQPAAPAAAGYYQRRR